MTAGLSYNSPYLADDVDAITSIAASYGIVDDVMAAKAAARIAAGLPAFEDGEEDDGDDDDDDDNDDGNKADTVDGGKRISNVGISDNVAALKHSNVVHSSAQAAVAAALAAAARISTDHGDNADDDSVLPIDVDLVSVLGDRGIYHSTFICPVTKSLAGYGSNPPVLLRCGHVISLEALAKITSTARHPRAPPLPPPPPGSGWAGQVVENVVFKCPTCPSDQTAAHTVVLKL